MELVLLKIKQANSRGVFKRKNVSDEKTVGFEPSIPELQLDTLEEIRSQTLFRPGNIVRPE